MYLQDGIGGTAQEVLQSLAQIALTENAIVRLFIVLMMGYAVFQVFFGNLKRGGILLIQIAVGSLYMFSVPRGYIDGFMSWCKQVIGLCLTAFLQATLLVVGLLVMNDHPLLGLETNTRANIMSAIYTTQSVVNLSRTVAAAVK